MGAGYRDKEHRSSWLSSSNTKYDLKWRGRKFDSIPRSQMLDSSSLSLLLTYSAPLYRFCPKHPPIENRVPRTPRSITLHVLKIVYLSGHQINRNSMSA